MIPASTITTTCPHDPHAHHHAAKTVERSVGMISSSTFRLRFALVHVDNFCFGIQACLLVLAAFFLPPLTVFAVEGFGGLLLLLLFSPLSLFSFCLGAFLCNIILTILGCKLVCFLFRLLIFMFRPLSLHSLSPSHHGLFSVL